jgi:aminomuconate-semialdehyde/2-hydroxymuconate-6-semialdehyde dehydrogenase
MEKILSYVDIAKKEGGRILSGGERASVPNLEGGYFVAPTVIEGVPVCGRVMQEEIFGPVVCLTPFETESQVIGWANGVRYGLSCSLWTRDLKRANRVSREMDVGTCWVNCWMMRDLSMPFGGVKDSGVGREGGEYSLEFFTEVKTICMA